MTDQLVHADESNYLYYTIRQLQLIYSYGNNNYMGGHKGVQQLLSSLRRILVNPAVTDIFAYFISHEASTALLLESRLSIPQETVYRSLRRLEKLGVIEKKRKINMRRHSQGGPKPTIFGLLTATEECIINCQREHLKMNSPKYRFAEEFALTFIDEYLEPRKLVEVDSYVVKKFLGEVRSPYNFGDLYNFARGCLNERGYKVW